MVTKSRGRLDGKVVVVIGAGSLGGSVAGEAGWGNGKAAAICYAREGAKVVCVDFFEDRAAETAAVIAAEGGSAIAHRADATVEDDVDAAMAAAVGAFGHLDVVHNNVGVGRAYGFVHEVKPADWQREMDQNLTSAYLGTRCAIPYLSSSGGGAIINTSSVLAVRFLRRQNTAYTVAKAAVEALTRATAVAYGPDNIRINCIRIGFSETPLVMSALEGLSDSERERQFAKSRAKVPLRHEHGDAFDVANAAVFLASDEAKHITGVVLNVDGGLEFAPM